MPFLVWGDGVQEPSSGSLNCTGVLTVKGALEMTHPLCEVNVAPYDRDGEGAPIEPSQSYKLVHKFREE